MISTDIFNSLFALDFFVHVFLYSYGCLLLYMAVPPPSVMNLPVVLLEIKFVYEQKDQTQQIYKTLLTHQSEISVVRSNARSGLPVPWSLRVNCWVQPPICNFSFSFSLGLSSDLMLPDITLCLRISINLPVFSRAVYFWRGCCVIVCFQHGLLM